MTHRYRWEIDGLRAIAIGFIILYNAKITILGHQPFKGGFIGIDIFFVISGYLITSIILKELVTTGSFSFKHFYEQRIRRIFPALLLVMLVSFPFAWMYLMTNNFISYANSIITSLSFSSNFFYHYSANTFGQVGALHKPFLHTWSLSVLGQYYILFPIILITTFRYLRKYIIHILILGFIVSLGIAELGSRNDPSATFFFIHTRIWELMAGSILAYFEIEKSSKNRLKDNNKQKEIYLTDAISLLSKSISYEIKDEEEIQGINNRIDLAKCEEIFQKRIKTRHMISGVTFINPQTSTISEESEIGIDVIIEANSHLRGSTKIADNCIIGPNSLIEDSMIGKHSNVINSTIFNSEIMENVCIGPYSHIRPGCSISSNCKIGNFVEIKNSLISKSVKINHLSYVGDSNVGEFTNIGAGTITANFDGIKKNKTNIGKNCNIGSNSVLIAPVNIGASLRVLSSLTLCISPKELVLSSAA